MSLAVRAAVDGRPPGLGWRIEPPPLQQPSLSLLGIDADPVDPTAVHVVATPPPTEEAAAQLAGARAWAPTIALVLFETASGRRPTSQLVRWVDERVLATVSLHARLTRRQPPASGALPAATVSSVRLQLPRPGAVEVTAHLKQGRRSAALAFRLEACRDRWLCTAVELGPGQRGAPVNR